MQLFKHLRIFGCWNTVFHQTNFRRSWRYLGNVTYYILAAQTIHFEVLLLNEASFSQIIRDQRELDAEQSIKVWQSLSKKHYQLQKLNRKFFKIRQTISIQRGKVHLELQQSVYPYSKFLYLKFALMQEETWRCFSVLPIKSFNQGSNKRECWK